MNQSQALGLKLLELRQQNNLTQKQLCEHLHIGRSTYSYFETGSRIPDIATLLSIANFYGVSIEGLLHGSIAKISQKHPDAEESIADIQILHHLNSKHIPLESVLNLTKADFDFLMEYKKLSKQDQAELKYLMNYKRKASSR